MIKKTKTKKQLSQKHFHLQIKTGNLIKKWTLIDSWSHVNSMLILHH